jgi:hypothetical protein
MRGRCDGRARRRLRGMLFSPAERIRRGRPRRWAEPVHRRHPGFSGPPPGGEMSGSGGISGIVPGDCALTGLTYRPGIKITSRVPARIGGAFWLSRARPTLIRGECRPRIWPGQRAGTAPLWESATWFPRPGHRLPGGLGGHARPRCCRPGTVRPVSLVYGRSGARSRRTWSAGPDRRSFRPHEPLRGRRLSAATLTHQSLPRAARAPAAAFLPVGLAAAIPLGWIASRRSARTWRYRRPGASRLARPGVSGTRTRRRGTGRDRAVSL